MHCDHRQWFGFQTWVRSRARDRRSCARGRRGELTGAARLCTLFSGGSTAVGLESTARSRVHAPLTRRYAIQLIALSAAHFVLARLGLAFDMPDSIAEAL